MSVGGVVFSSTSAVFPVALFQGAGCVPIIVQPGSSLYWLLFRLVAGRIPQWFWCVRLIVWVCGC